MPLGKKKLAEQIIPTLLSAYGGYGHCMGPTFNFEHRLWFDRGRRT
jgi:prolyl oligopeptidase PreP (S9A serine peptidase family)